MKYNFVFTGEGRPNVVAIEKFPQENGVLLEAPEGFDLLRAEDWRYASAGWVYDPLPPVEEPEPGPTTEERIAELEEALDLLLSGVTE